MLSILAMEGAQCYPNQLWHGNIMGKVILGGVWVTGGWDMTVSEEQIWTVSLVLKFNIYRFKGSKSISGWMGRMEISVSTIFWHLRAPLCGAIKTYFTACLEPKFLCEDATTCLEESKVSGDQECKKIKCVENSTLFFPPLLIFFLGLQWGLWLSTGNYLLWNSFAMITLVIALKPTLFPYLGPKCTRVLLPLTLVT